MEKNSYLTCILVDKKVLEFQGMCTTVREFSSDMMVFIAKNFETQVELILEIIPKSQIERILFHHTEEEIKKLKEV